MKVVFLLLCLGGGPSVFGAYLDKPGDLSEAGPVSQSDQISLGPNEQAMLEELVDEAIAQEELARSRRSDLLAKKFGKINRISSLEHNPIDEYGPPPVSYGTKSFSLWSFKKAILNALLQAIKAITGGVLALKGQIVKVKGHLVAAKGKLLETKGDAITEFGKHLATKALLTPVHVSNYDHSGPAQGSPYPAASPHVPPSTSYGTPHASAHNPQLTNSYGAPVYGPPSSGPYPAPAPPSSYGAPPPAHSYIPPPNSGFGGDYLQAAQGFPPTLFGHQMDFNHHLKRDVIDQKQGTLDGVQAGLILLKPIRSQTDTQEQQNVYQPPQAFSKSSDNRRIDGTPTIGFY